MWQKCTKRHELTFFCSSLVNSEPTWLRPEQLKFEANIFIQNTQEIKRTLFNWTKQDKTCEFSRKSSFSSYVQKKKKTQKNQQLIQLILCQLDSEGWRKEKSTRLVLFSVRKLPTSCVFWVFFRTMGVNSVSDFFFQIHLCCIIFKPCEACV